MKITVPVVNGVLARAKKVVETAGKTVEQVIREYLKRLTDDPDADMEEFRRLSARGDSRGWRFHRDEIYER
jgi:hypothetical protein